MSNSPPATTLSDSVSCGTERSRAFLCQLQKDVKLWFCMLLCLFLFRWLMVGLFHSQAGPSAGGRDLLLCLLTGLRFDASVAGYWLILPLAMTAACAFGNFSRLADRIRLLTGFLFLVLTSLLCVVTVGFFREFHDQFNDWVFGILLDDRRAIFRTIWAEYHPVLCVAGVLPVVTLGGLLLRRILRRPYIEPKRAPNRWLVALAGSLALVLLVGAIRGSLGGRPLQMKDTAITGDDFLNKLVPNPYYALKNAIQSQRLLTRASGLKTFLPDGDIRAAAQLIFPAAGGGSKLDERLLKSARGPAGQPPKHVFLVVMESFDTWSMLPEYQCLGLTPRLSELAKEGIFIKAFTFAGHGTMPSLGTLITGLPFSGVFENYQPSARQPLPCSTAPIFKQLGYTTRFFYGGYLSWQRVGEFCKDQGFDEIHGGGHVRPGGLHEEWGVPDEELFRFVVQTVADDKPSFNLIMSTSYHPPYGLDVYALGFPLRETPPALKPRWDGHVDLKVFGHLWYADRCLGNFVRDMESKVGGALFAITGDHWSRKFINQNPSLYERAAVPCVFYGKQALSGVTPPAQMAGAHIDIVPTLVELCAPAGFGYHSFGRDMFDPRLPALGIGFRAVVGPDFIFSPARPDRVESLPGQPPAASAPSPATLRRLYQATLGVGWWRAVKGNLLPAPPNGTNANLAAQP